MRCSEKKRYYSDIDAISGAIRASRKGAALRPYKCDVCFYWHLTTKKKREKING